MIHRRAYPNLRMFLEKSGTSQRVLAQRVGVEPSHLSHILAGRRSPSLSLAARIAREANIPIESLLELAS
jgi:transcriptional regulator with XRE-family HTH domain